MFLTLRIIFFVLIIINNFLSSALAEVDFSLDYSVSSDWLEKDSQRTYNHSLSLDGSYSIKEDLTFLSGIDTGYFSYGQAVPANQRWEVKSFSLGITKPIELGKWKKEEHKINTLIMAVFPTDEDSRYEGYRSLIFSKLSLASKFYSAFLMTNGLDFRIFVNRYDYSPGSGESNPLLSLAYNLGLSYSFHKNWKVAWGGSIKASQQINSLITVNANNVLALAYNKEPYSLGIRYSNGSFLDDTVENLWFIDRYRQMVQLTFSVNF